MMRIPISPTPPPPCTRRRGAGDLQRGYKRGRRLTPIFFTPEEKARRGYVA